MGRPPFLDSIWAAAKWIVRGIKELKVGRGVIRFSAKTPPLDKEVSAAAVIAEAYGSKIFLRGSLVEGADALIDGVKWEIKTINAATNNAVAKNIKKAVKGQSSRVIIDGRAVGLTEEEALKGIERAARDEYSAVELIILLPDKIMRF